MKRNYILLLAILFSSINLFAQSSLWDISIDLSHLKSQSIDIIQSVEKGQYARTNYEDLVKTLRKAPQEFGQNTKDLTLELPLPNGELHTFYVVESRIMQDGISARYPMIRSYKIRSTTNKLITGRIGTGTLGFYGTIRTLDGLAYIDRVQANNENDYMAYYVADYKPAGYEDISYCGVDHHSGDEAIMDNVLSSYDSRLKTRSLLGEKVPLNTYRIAISCTGEFGKKQGTVANALSQINIAVSKVNEILEREMAIRFILVDDNDKVLYLDKDTDPFVNTDSGGALLSQNNVLLNGKIGYENYDVGHVYNGPCDVGGIASLSSVCTGIKGQGCTCHYSSNIDYMASNVTTHELGHQFSANHTFNNCNGNESPYGYEPGSGSTIMSYAGLCGPALNLGPEYNYYHGHNIKEMTDFITLGSGKSCKTEIPTENEAPIVIVSYEDGFYIPIETPFILDGEGSDPDGDELYYSWEQFNVGPAGIPGEPIGNAPIFISEFPDTSSHRYFPKLYKTVNGTSDKTEVLPTYDRELTFRLTVRDYDDIAPATDYGEVDFLATESAGPFLVNFPNQSISTVAGDTMEVTWDVANTDGELVNCQKVDILLSTDGGYTYSLILEANTSNDGSEKIIIPNEIGVQNRIMVRAADNIFFDISNSNFEITEASDPGFHFYVQNGFKKYCLPSTPTIELNTTSFGNFADPVTFEIIGGVPPNATYEFSSNPIFPGDATTITFEMASVVESGIYDILIQSIAGEDTIVKTSSMQILSSDFSDLALLAPEDALSGVEQVPTFTWVNDLDASYYIFELSDNPSFENGTINIETYTGDHNLELTQALYKNEVYFWRVTGVNDCGISSQTEISAFATEALSCQDYPYNQVPFYLSQVGTPEYNLTTELVTAGQVSDVNVKLLKGGHGNFKQLSATLTSPSGTEVLLFEDKCFGSTTFDGGFDQESPIDISCPLANGNQYLPIGDLSTMYGEDIQGTWNLHVSDNKSGDGGQINEYILEICSNAALDAPELIQNLALNAVPGEYDFINNGRLIVTDANNTADELVYTLVTTPRNGTLKLKYIELGVGDTFTQQDLIDNNLIYFHDGVDQNPATDEFDFIVEDGEGGWIPRTTFVINIDQINPSINQELDYIVDLYPNPATDQLFIDIRGSESFDAKIKFYNMLGQLVHTTTHTNNNSINISVLSIGAYQVQIEIDGRMTTKKLIITK